MMTTKDIPLPKDLALIVIDYKKEFEEYEKYILSLPKDLALIVMDYIKEFKKCEIYTEMYRWISGPYIHSDHKNKLSTDEYYKMYSHHPNIFNIMTKKELRHNINKIQNECFWAYSD